MRAVIADDSLLLREGITRLLAEGGIEVAAGVGDAEALVAAVAKQQPDLAIIDVRMPPGYQDEGLRAAIEIRRRWPKVALLVLSQFVEERYATELLSSDTRAVGYLLKDRVADIDEFIEAARRVAAGGTALDPEVVRQLLARSRKADPLARLTAARGTRSHGGRTLQPRHRRGAGGHARSGRKACRRHPHETRPAAWQRAARSSGHGSRPVPEQLSRSGLGRRPAFGSGEIVYK